MRVDTSWVLLSEVSGSHRKGTHKLREYHRPTDAEHEAVTTLLDDAIKAMVAKGEDLGISRILLSQLLAQTLPSTVTIGRMQVHDNPYDPWDTKPAILPPRTEGYIAIAVTVFIPDKNAEFHCGVDRIYPKWWSS